MKNLLGKSLKEKPILATFLIAIIIGLICLIIFVLKFFEPPMKDVPNLILSTEYSDSLKIKPISYNLLINNKEVMVEDEFDVNNYDYSNCTVYKSYDNFMMLKMVNDNKRSFENISKVTYMYNSETNKFEEYETDYDSFKSKEKFIYLNSSSGKNHTYVSVYTVKYGNDGYAKFPIKVVEQSSLNLGIIREYTNTYFSDEAKIKEIVSNLHFGNYIEDSKSDLENNSVNLTYKYRIDSESRDSVAMALFCIFDDLKEINFYSENTEFIIQNGNERQEITDKNPMIVTRESLKEIYYFDIDTLKNDLGM